MKIRTILYYLLIGCTAMIAENAAGMVITPPAVEACLRFQEKSSDLDERSAIILENFLMFSFSGKFLDPTLRELTIVINGNTKEAESKMGNGMARELLSRRQNTLSMFILCNSNDNLLHLTSELYVSRNDELMRDLSASQHVEKSCDAKVHGYFEQQDANKRFCSSPYACNVICTATSCK